MNINNLLNYKFKAYAKKVNKYKNPILSFILI